MQQYKKNQKTLPVFNQCCFRSAHGCAVLSGYSLFGRPPFNPMKAAQCHMKPKWLTLKIPGSEAVLPHLWAHRANTLETLLLRLCIT